jgi:hypothetical protein
MVELSAVSAVASEANGCTTVGTDIVWHRPSVSGRWRRDNLSSCSQHLRLPEAAERRHVRLRRCMIQIVTICRGIMSDTFVESCWDGSDMFRYELAMNCGWVVLGSNAKNAKNAKYCKNQLCPVRALGESTASLPPALGSSILAPCSSCIPTMDTAHCARSRTKQQLAD